jgi:hypothetical protein
VAPQGAVTSATACPPLITGSDWQAGAPSAQAGSPAMPSFQGGPGSPPRSAPCAGGRHAGCGHLGAIARGQQGRGRPSVLPCFCTCHSACPLGSRLWVIPRTVWQQQCTCPGTEQAARKLDEADRHTPDFAHFEREQQERREKSEHERQERRAARREALDAARAAGAGQTLQQITEIYQAELRSRGLPPPSGLLLDAHADTIARNRQKMSLIFAARVLAEMGKELSQLRKFSWHPP